MESNGQSDEGGETMPDWLERWQQSPDDELLYVPQDSGSHEPADQEPEPITAESLRQMARERWPDPAEWVCTVEGTWRPLTAAEDAAIEAAVRTALRAHEEPPA